MNELERIKMFFSKFLGSTLGAFVAMFFSRFIGSEGKGLNLVLFAILILSLSFLFRLYSLSLYRRYGLSLVFLLYVSLFCVASLFCYCIRIYVVSNIGFLFSYVLTVFMGTCAVSGSGGQIIPHSSPSNSSSEDSFGLQVLSEPWPVTHNLAYESSLINRILSLENDNCIFILDKER